jgi:hypothetical protein
LRDVGATVEQYDQHFWRNGHSVRIMVFDDSSTANQEKYYPLLADPDPQSCLLYRPSRKGEVPLVPQRAIARRAARGLVRNLFRPSYGGNRNCTLMYTLGGLMVISDDDMRPFGTRPATRPGR